MKNVVLLPRPDYRSIDHNKFPQCFEAIFVQNIARNKSNHLGHISVTHNKKDTEKGFLFGIYQYFVYI